MARPRRWEFSYDPRAKARRHRLAPGVGHSLMVPVVLGAYRLLGLSGSLYSHVGWWPIHLEPNIIPFELEHGREAERQAFNDRHFAEVERQLKPVRGLHAGHLHLFAPIVSHGAMLGLLTTGPIALTRPTSNDVTERWRWLTGRQGHPSDPEFAAFLSTTLSSVVLDKGRDRIFESLLGLVAKLLSGQGSAEQMVNEAERLLVKLAPVRRIERTWTAVQTLLDDRSPRMLYSAWRQGERQDVGFSRPVDHILVGLTVSPRPGPDPVDEAIRRDAFQRAAVDLARSAGDVIAGQVGDHGVVFLLAGDKAQGSPRKVRELAERAATLARQRFGLSAHFGASIASEALPLSRSYHAALGAAESALTDGNRLEIAEAGARHPDRPLWHLQQQLASLAEERPNLLPARFDRYLESVALHAGYRFEPALAHLEVGFQRMAEALVKSGALDEKSMVSMTDGLARVAAEVRTVSELFTAYRRAVADLSEAVLHPVPARQDRHLQGAVEYIRQHFTQPLSFKKVARVAGFNATYFSELFRKREGVTFEKYVLGLRLERAQQLLARTKHDVGRVAILCGFNSPQYFCRAFRRTVGRAPLDYRANPQVVGAISSGAAGSTFPSRPYRQSASRKAR
jgi:AraC-like DNA-binding protein